MSNADWRPICGNSPVQPAMLEVGDTLVKKDTGCIYKVIKVTWIGEVEKEYANGHKHTRPVLDWLYDCETVVGDDRTHVRYYEKRLDEFYKVPDASKAVQAIFLEA